MPVLFLRHDFEHDGIKGDNFVKFLHLCLEHSTMFSMSRRLLPHDRQYRVIPNTVEPALEPYWVKTLQPSCWCGYPKKVDNYVQMIYKATEESIGVLAYYYEDVFLTFRPSVQPSLPKMPNRRFLFPGERPFFWSLYEDLCFWQNDTMIIGTVSHEHICATNRIDDTFASRLSELAVWLPWDHGVFYMDRVHL